MSKEIDPAMHTAEHILNQTMDRLFATGRSFGAHLEKKKSKCDYRLDRPLSEAEVAEVEERVNEVIAAGLSVTAHFEPLEAARGRYDLGKLPDPRPATLRVVKVGDYDACPCSGVHVENTSAVGRFRIISTSHADGVLRIRFRLERPGD